MKGLATKIVKGQEKKVKGQAKKNKQGIKRKVSSESSGQKKQRTEQQTQQQTEQQTEPQARRRSGRFLKLKSAKEELTEIVNKKLSAYEGENCAAEQASVLSTIKKVAKGLNDAIVNNQDPQHSYVTIDGGITQHEDYAGSKQPNSLYACVATDTTGNKLGFYNSSSHAEMHLIDQLTKPPKTLYCNMAPCSSCKVALLLMGVKSEYIKEYKETSITKTTCWKAPRLLTTCAPAKKKIKKLLEDAVQEIRKGDDYKDHNVAFAFGETLVGVKEEERESAEHIINMDFSTQEEYVINCISKLRGK